MNGTGRTDVRTFTAEHTTLFFDPDGESIAELDQGERFIAWTRDSVCGLAKAEAPRGFHIDEIIKRIGGACPLTGPFYVRGANAGSVLEVALHRVDPRPLDGEGWTAIFQGFGALTHEDFSLQPSLKPHTTLVPYRRGVAELRYPHRTIKIPLKPFLGTIGVAPLRERRMSFSQSPEYLGDVDLPAIGPGATVVLPVNVDGALLAFGDAHGAQGDGEITGAAIEIEAEVELSVQVRDPDEVGFVRLPQVNTSEWIGSVAGLQGNHLGDCSRAAYTDLVKRLVQSHGFRTNQAYELLGQVGRLTVGNMIDPFYSVLATVERRYLRSE